MRAFDGSLYLAGRGELDACAAFDFCWPAPLSPVTVPSSGETLNVSQLPPDLVTYIASRQAQGAQLRVCSRQGGEVIKLDSSAHTRRVKSLLQEARIAPWLRSRLPFLWLDKQLIGVIGIGFIKPE